MTAARLALFSILAAAAGAGHAFAQSAACKAPSAPATITLTPLSAAPTKPAPLACDEKNTCKKPEIDAYNAAAKQYNDAITALNDSRNHRVDQANSYITQLNAFNKDTQAYISCEHDRMTALLAADGAKP